ncbi:VPLPA-CTERM sorting domain-containing protein [uncultured Roseovarius sp.]|uniref:VPLPA-CTERM sorting domain-containing protein n=1 Tax=uncultured Roseovarius sp. TaxID=293344 RepID=UPI0026135B18|nr:VPLPA-CTERM sorting domain-containing protein [uncultured Roseovarius sp.]
MKVIQSVLGAGALAVALMAMPAQAAFIEVHSDKKYTGGGSEGSGRGQGFEMLANTSVNSIGIEANLNRLSYTIDIFASTNGRSAGSILASFTRTLGGAGFGWYDMAVNYTFNTNSYYVVNWRPSTGGDWVVQSGNPGNAGINYYNDNALPETDGPFRLVEGFAGSVPNSGNSLHPSMRYGVGATVPLPASLPLLIGGFGLLGFVGRRRKG